MKILLVQLPHPYCVYNQGQPYSLPLGISYLKAMAYKYKEDIFKNVNVSILPQEITDSAGDCLLIEQIISEQPDLIGFSCFCWNVQRSLYIAEQIKRRIPEIKIMIGGQEVTYDNLDSVFLPHIDIAVIGEGEEIFVELVKHFSSGGFPLEKIEGIVYRNGGKIVLNKPRNPIKRLDSIPSPFLLKYMIPYNYQVFLGIEVARGCPFRCKYCYYSKGLSMVRTFSPDRIKEEIIFIKKNISNHRRMVRLYGSSFNIGVFSRSEMAQICRMLGNINSDNMLLLSCALCAEFVDEEFAKLLSEATIKFVSIGLQSIHPNILRCINRGTNMRRFLRGVDNLRKYGIVPKIDGYIIGLPKETPDTIKKTIEFLRKYDLIKHAEVFPLSLLPDTVLKKEAKDLGIKFNPFPPYYVVSTPTLTYQDIRSALLAHERLAPFSFNHYARMPLPNLFVRSSFKEVSGLAIDSNAKEWHSFPIFMIRLEIDSAWAQEKIGKLLNSIVDKVCNKLFVWVSLKNDHGYGMVILRELLNRLYKFNPHLDCYIVIETDSDFSIDFVSELNRITYRNTYVDNLFYYSTPHPEQKWRRGKVCIILPWNKNFSNKWLLSIKKQAFVVWSVTPSFNNTVTNAIKSCISKKGDGILLDFGASLGKKNILEILKIIASIINNTDTLTEIRFRDWVIQQLWDYLYRENRRFGYKPYLFSGTSFHVNYDGEVKINLFDARNLLADLMEWIS